MNADEITEEEYKPWSQVGVEWTAALDNGMRVKGLFVGAAKTLEQAKISTSIHFRINLGFLLMQQGGEGLSS